MTYGTFTSTAARSHLWQYTVLATCLGTHLTKYLKATKGEWALESAGSVA